MLQERLKMVVIESSYDLYQNLWYLIKKNLPVKYRLVNVVVKLKRVTVRDTKLPSSTDEFSEEFAGVPFLLFWSFFLGYNQVKLDEKSRDLTVFMTPLDLMRITILPQSATNFVAQFV